MAKEEFCMLAHDWEPHRNVGLGGWFVSEKLDGMRALWIPETRGLTVDRVPFANREKDSRLHICTGLWSRLRKPIFAPDWWLNRLPKDVRLDGELWLGRQMFQSVMSVCKTLVPGDGWKHVKYKVFDVPGKYPVFEYNYNFLINPDSGIRNDVVEAVDQFRLPTNHSAALDKMAEILDNVTSMGGEGLMLRKASSMWSPQRSYELLKVKKFLEGEGTVTGYTFGRATDKGSRLLGMMGALILLTDSGNRLEISGFTDEERCFNNSEIEDIARSMPGKDAPVNVIHPRFPRGMRVRYRYRELTNDGVPKEARYFR